MESLDLSIQEARQILTGALPFVFDYLQPTDMVKIGREAVQWGKRYLSGQITLRQGLQNLNKAVYENFQYRKGATNFSTDVSFVWRDHIGVCQDFAHVMLSVLRTAGLPFRYVRLHRDSASSWRKWGKKKADGFGSNTCMGRSSPAGPNLGCAGSYKQSVERRAAHSRLFRAATPATLLQFGEPSRGAEIRS